MRFRKLKKKLATFGIGWDKSVGKGSHGAFVGLSRITKVKQVYPLPKKQQTEVSPKYIKPLRRRFELTPEHGVTDRQFFT